MGLEPGTPDQSVRRANHCAMLALYRSVTRSKSYGNQPFMILPKMLKPAKKLDSSNSEQSKEHKLVNVHNQEILHIDQINYN